MKINEQIIVFVSTSKKFYLILRNCCFVEAVDCPKVIPWSLSVREQWEMNQRAHLHVWVQCKINMGGSSQQLKGVQHVAGTESLHRVNWEHRLGMLLRVQLIVLAEVKSFWKHPGWVGEALLTDQTKRPSTTQRGWKDFTPLKMSGPDHLLPVVKENAIALCSTASENGLL